MSQVHYINIVQPDKPPVLPVALKSQKKPNLDFFLEDMLLPYRASRSYKMEQIIDYRAAIAWAYRSRLVFVLADGSPKLRHFVTHLVTQAGSRPSSTLSIQ